MVNTKTHPGMFRCYEAALPDEPMFVILGRDPAGPATLEYWAQQRIQQGKVHEPDDRDRIKAAVDEARDMAEWRQRMLDHAEECGLPPVWKLPRPDEHGDDRPVRMSLPNSLNRSYVFSMENADKTFISIGEGEMEVSLAALVDHYRQRPKVESSAVREAHDYYPDPDGDPIKVTPLSYSRMSELLDYATCYGEFDENTPDGTISKYGEGMSSPMNAERRTAIWVYKRCMGIIPEGAEPPVAAEPVPTVAVYHEGLFAVPGVDKPQTMEQIAAMYRKAALSVDKSPTLDSAPEDLAHAPEVPHHRFSVFHEAGDYAYARGLEVNPMHLATALDAMAKSGWHLCAIFGQTDAQHIGFIFRREVERFSAFEIAHGFGGGFPATAPAEESEEFKRFKAGEPLDKIRDIRFTVQGLDPETTHYRNAEWTGDPEKLIKALGDAKPEVRETFLRQEQVSSLAHYWRVASVGSLIRLIRLLDWQDRINLLSPISAEMVQKVLNCGGEGQEPCPDWGRGLAI